MSSRSSLALAACLLLAVTTSGQQSANAFDAARVILDATKPQFQRLIDLDGDPRLDALGMRAVNGVMELRLYRNAGNGSFVSFWMQTFSWGNVGPVNVTSDAALEIGDFDGDGLRDDFAVNVGTQLRLFRGNGMTAPTAVPPLTLPGLGLDLCVRDLDQDGIDDLLVTTSSLLTLARNPLSLAPSYDYAFAPGLIPANTDLLPIRVPGGNHVLIAGDNTWSYATGGGFSAGPLFGSSIAAGRGGVGDLDGDGDEDAVVFLPNGQFQVIRQGVSGSLVIETMQDGGPGGGELIDLDGDGDLDAIRCVGDGLPLGITDNTAASRFEFSSNDGTGTFSPARSLRGLGARRFAGASDLDGDGDLDLLAGRAIWFGENGRSLFERPGAISSSLSRSLSDVDGDGDPDFGLELARFLANDGRGQLRTEAVHFIGTPPPLQSGGDTAVGDWDGDGRDDLAISDGSSVGLALNRGGGSFQWVPYAVASGPTATAFLGDTHAVDLDGDGDLDCIGTFAIPSGPVITSIALNQGANGFSTGPSLSHERVVAWGDFDGDGRVDLLSRSDLWGVQSGTLILRRQLPSGAFAPPVGLLNGNTLNGSPLVFDGDADGDLDIVAFLAGTGHVVLTNDGSGSFTDTVLVSVPGPNLGEMGYTLADFDGDGLRDLIAMPAPAAPGCSLVLPGTTFGFAPSSITHCCAPRAAIDIDADGDLDLVDIRSASLYLNPRIAGPNAPERRQYGIGSPGSAGRIPLLGASGTLVEGGVLTLRVRNGLGGAPVHLAASVFATELLDHPLPGLTSYVDPLAPTTLLLPPASLGGILGIPGTGAFDGTFSIPFGIGGIGLTLQAFALDPQGPWGVSASQALRLRFGL